MRSPQELANYYTGRVQENIYKNFEIHFCEERVKYFKVLSLNNK